MIDVVLPVLDEVEAIGWVLPRMPKGFRAVVVDNGSTDGSSERAASLGATVVVAERRGFGAACFAGLTAATSEIVCFMDCDASLDPRDLTAVCRPLVDGRADLVLGARRPQRGAWPPHARIANRWLASEVNRRLGTRLHDLGPMRAARRDRLIDLDLRDRRSGWPLEMVLAAGDAGWCIDEVPVPYLRRTGRSKVTGTVRGTLGAVRDMRAQLRSWPGGASPPPPADSTSTPTDHPEERHDLHRTHPPQRDRRHLRRHRTHPVARRADRGGGADPVG